MSVIFAHVHVCVCVHVNLCVVCVCPCILSVTVYHVCACVCVCVLPHVYNVVCYASVQSMCTFRGADGDTMYIQWSNGPIQWGYNACTMDFLW